MALLLKNSDIESLVDMRDAIDAVREGFRAEGEGAVQMPPLVLIRTRNGFLRILTSVVDGIGYMGFKAMNKVNGTGVRYMIQLYDVESGELLSIMDAKIITTLRTAATSALAAVYLSREDAETVGCLGSARESRAQLEALCAVRNVKVAKVYSPTEENRRKFADEMSELLKIEVKPASTPEEAVSGTDISYVVTNSTRQFVEAKWFSPGMHLNAVGATRPEQKEVLPEVFAKADRIVMDMKENVIHEAGDVIDALNSKSFSPDSVDDLNELIVGKKPGRRSSSEFTLFKSVGSATQDISLAAVIYKRARERGLGVDLGEFPYLKVKTT